MIIIAVGLAFTERQGPRQVAGLRIGIVKQQLFEPCPGLLAEVGRGARLAVVFEDRLLLDLVIGLEPDESEFGRLACADIAESAALQESGLQCQLWRQQGMCLRLRR